MPPWRGCSISTAWSGWRSSQSTARPRRSSACGRGAIACCSRPTTRGHASRTRRPSSTAWVSRPRATWSPRRWPPPRWLTPASGCWCAAVPTPDGLIPGGGALVAAVAYAAGVRPVVAGKPHRPMADLNRALAGGEVTVVGDRPETDGAFAAALGYRFALVLTGVTGEADLPVEPSPDVVAASLADLVVSGPPP